MSSGFGSTDQVTRRVTDLERRLRELQQTVEALGTGGAAFSIGSTTTGAAGSSADVILTETSPDVYQFAFTIPQGATGATGATGPAGPVNSLSIGTVSTGAAGSAASASITGTAPSQTLSLTIPKGDTGDAGARGSKWSSGTAAPLSSFGAIDDFHLNRTTGDVYQKTGASTWTLVDNLTGPQGPQGVPGPTGSVSALVGSFTMSTVAATTTVTDSNVTATSKIFFAPSNANAWSVDGAITSVSQAAGSFTITHQISTLTRTYNYLVIN